MESSGSACHEERRRLLPDVDDMLSTSSDEGTVVAESDAKMASLDTVRRIVSGSADGNSLVGAGDTALQAKPFLFVRDSQVPGADTKTVFESWTIGYHAPATRVSAWYNWMGVRWWTRTEVEDAHILSVVPNAHFSQDELARVVERDTETFIPEATAALANAGAGSFCCISRRSLPSLRRKQQQSPILPQQQRQQQSCMTAAAAAARLQSADLERRLRRLDWAVQDEVYDLLSDRVQSSSNAFRRRDWKVVMLVEVPGGEMTDAGTGPRHWSHEALLAGGHQGCGITRALRRVMGGGSGQGRNGSGSGSGAAPAPASSSQAMPVTEYRMILRGTEVKSTEEGWESHNRYSRPWKDIDEREVGEARAVAAAEAVAGADKYVDF